MQPRECRLNDGSLVQIRDIRPDDAEELRRGFERLSPESRYRRFMGAMSTLSPSMIEYLTSVDGKNHVAIVALVRSAAGERGVGVARFVRLREEPSVAEAAIAVADDMHRKGLGQTLAALLVEEALARGIAHFRGEVLVDNLACRRLLADSGARLGPSEDGRLAFDVPLSGDEESRRVTARRVFGAASQQFLSHGTSNNRR